MRLSSVVLVVLVALALASCARSRGNVRVGVDVPVPHATPVCFLKSPMPPNIEHSVIGDIGGSKQWYGSAEEVLALMATQARMMGADALVNVSVAHKIGWIAWARPVASGIAVKLKNKDDLNCVTAGGQLR